MKVVEPVAPRLSVTVTVTGTPVCGPSAVATPPMRPVAAAIDSLAGSPLADQDREPVPPAAFSGSDTRVFTAAPGAR
jgi:hypothetical protein